MAITSGNKTRIPIYFKTAQLRYAVIYVLVTFIVLLFLNVYTSGISQQLFYSSKKTSMIEICHLATSEIADLEVMNRSTLENAVADLALLQRTRVIITDQNCKALYDSAGNLSVVGQYVLYPEIIDALAGNDVFFWRYHRGNMQSYAAVPIFSYGELLGCFYMAEYDSTQGALISSIQQNILVITLTLEIVIFLFSLISSVLYSRRLRRILDSIRIARDGDYTHSVNMHGNDELQILGRAFDDLIGRLRISERKRSQFVSDASHELKTPLASIKLLSDSILQNPMDTQTVREFVQDIGNEAERLNKMSQKLLTLSRADNNDEPNREIIYIIPTLQRVVRMLSMIANESNIRIELDLSTDSTVLIHEDDLYQILFNLVENGIKYNRQGGTLFLSVHREQDNAVIRIRDTGYGIPQESIEHIFERFYRVDKARSRSTGGSGLGLSIVRSIVKRNDGDIRVESSAGEGTCFTLTLPVFDMEVDAT